MRTVQNKSIVHNSLLAAALLTSGLLSGLPHVVAAPDAEKVSKESKPAAAYERMVVIGASASAGIGTKGEIGPGGRSVRLADALDAMIKKDHTKVRDYSSAGFFMSALQTGKKQQEQALSDDPTAVVALDYLFWFAYGMKENRERQADLEEGLKLLEGFKCPTLISLLPDMRSSEGKGGTGLMKGMTPSVTLLGEFNKRIAKWAKGRENVILVPLKDCLEDLRAGKAIKVGRNKWKSKALTQLLQKDELHPTIEGVSMMSALALETLVKSDKKIKRSLFNLNVKPIAKKLIKERQKDAG